MSPYEAFSGRGMRQVRGVINGYLRRVLHELPQLASGKLGLDEVQAYLCGEISSAHRQDVRTSSVGCVTLDHDMAERHGWKASEIVYANLLLGQVSRLVGAGAVRRNPTWYAHVDGDLVFVGAPKVKPDRRANVRPRKKDWRRVKSVDVARLFPVMFSDGVQASGVVAHFVPPFSERLVKDRISRIHGGGKYAITYYDRRHVIVHHDVFLVPGRPKRPADKE